MMKNILIGVLLVAAGLGAAQAQDVKHFIFVRHGLSVNNLISQGLQVKTFMKQFGGEDPLQTCLDALPEGQKSSCKPLIGASLNKRDTCLSNIDGSSPSGRAQMIATGKVLFGADRTTDTHNIFNDGNFAGKKFSKIFVSPLRRTQETAVQIFGKAAKAANIPMVPCPWAHEQKKSLSDVGLDGPQAAGFARCLATSFLGEGADTQAPMAAFATSAATLGAYGTSQSLPDAEFPFYPAGDKEKRPYMCKRMDKLREFIWDNTPDAGAAIIVAHSAVIRYQFQRFIKSAKPDNGAMIYGKLERQEDGSLEWTEDSGVLLSTKIEAPGLPAWLKAPKDHIDMKATCESVYTGLKKYAIGSLKHSKQRNFVLKLQGEDPYLWYINNKKYTKFFIAQSGEGEAKVPRVTASATKTGTFKSCAALRESPSDVTSATHIRIEGGKTTEVRDTTGAPKGFMVIFSTSGGEAVLQSMLRELCGLTDPTAEPAEADAEEHEEAAFNSFVSSAEFSELTSKSVGVTSTADSTLTSAAPPPLSNSALRPNGKAKTV